jgi:hypothetical protein
MTTLNYTLLPNGAPYAINLVNPPLASMTVGASRVVEASAVFASGPVDVTQAAVYAAASGSTNVFSVGTGGAITATGIGIDLLSVSYGGLTATAPVLVGPCTYALYPPDQIVPYTGGSVTIQVTTQSGCAWTASGGATWLPLVQSSGSGSGAITLTAAANSTGVTEATIVSLGGLEAVATQPAAACNYSLSENRITASSIGASGTITATTTCPVIAASDQSWLTAAPFGNAVQFAIAPNSGTTQRSATLTVGAVGIPVTQAGVLACDVNQDGAVTVVDAQQIVNQALGTAPAVSDLNGDGVVSVADVQFVINAVIGFGCAAL